MFGGPTKSWEQKSKGDIIATMIAFVVLGGIVIINTLTTALTMWREHSLFAAIWCVAGLCFVAAIVVIYLRGAITELRRRRRSMTHSKEHQPPA
jgi:hypothetical protein